MLIPTLGVQVGRNLVRRPPQLGFNVEHRMPARARLKPHIQNVHLLAKVVLRSTRGAGRSRRQQRRSRMRIPGVRAFLAEELHYRAVDRPIVQRRMAALAQKHGDRHTPDALARDAPVRPRSDHVRDALLAPRRIPDHGRNFVQRPLPEAHHAAVRRSNRCLHRDEPLLRGAKDHGMVASPAVRIRVMNLDARHQGATLAHQLDDRRIRLEDRQAVILRQPVADAPTGINVAQLRQAIAGASDKVIGPVRGRRVHRAGTLIRGHVVCVDTQDRALEKGVLEGHTIQLRALKSRNFRRLRQPADHARRLRQRLGNDVNRAIRRILQRHIRQLGIERDRQRRRQRPRRGRPDDGVHRLPCQYRIDRRGIRRQPIAHVD